MSKTVKELMEEKDKNVGTVRATFEMVSKDDMKTSVVLDNCTTPQLALLGGHIIKQISDAEGMDVFAVAAMLVEASMFVKDEK